jgi:alkylation response protein AidB-like acyl-CoA dehydrogenase
MTREKQKAAARLYRVSRAIRIYEGASEIQKIIIARSTYLKPLCILRTVSRGRP